MKLKDKHIVVTGAVGSLGRVIVDGLHKKGARVFALDIDRTGLDGLRNEYGAVVKACDLTNFDGVKAVIDDIVNEYGVPDALINNAGLLCSMPLVGFDKSGLRFHDKETWDRAIAINLSSVFHVTVNLVPHMLRKRKRGVILNISSISAGGNLGQSAYSAAKAGVEALTSTWAAELGPLGIRAACIAPGFFNTDSTHKAVSDETISVLKNETPLRRLGEAEELKDAAIFVLENDYFNGKTLRLDGGLRIS